METLTKTIKRLTEEDFKLLINQVSPNRFSKPYIVLESARKYDYSDSQMIDLLQVNPSTYYTLKSRLLSKVSNILSKKVDNPISVLLDEVSRVPAMLYGDNKRVAIRALKELEKQLLEYDLSNELIIVYKVLARLNMYGPEFDHYERLYNKYVAFSLASVKGENLFYDFILDAGNYMLTRSEDSLDRMQNVMRELSNVCELYDSHRLFVFYNIIRIYYLCITSDSAEGLEAKEMEVDKTLQQIQEIFNKYSLDTLYSNLRFIVDFLAFEFYQKINHTARARHYYKIANEAINELAGQHILTFHVIQFLGSKLDMFLKTRELDTLVDLNERLQEVFDIDKDEVYHYVSFQRYLAISKFYMGDFSGSARILNQLRNAVGLKQFWYTDVDCRLFQALQYCILREEDLCLQITNSISRYVREDKNGYKNIKAFIKMLKASFKESSGDKKARKIKTLYETFRKLNTGSGKVLGYVVLDDNMIQKMAG